LDAGKAPVHLRGDPRPQEEEQEQMQDEKERHKEEFPLTGLMAESRHCDQCTERAESCKEEE